MAVTSEILTYEADGLQMVSHFYVDRAIPGHKPGILLFPEAFGLGEHVKSQAQRLAALGYAALASDLHGEGKVYSDLGDVMPLIGPLRQNPLLIRARTIGALQALVARSEVDATKIAATGYCFGGTMALELARSGAALKAAVGFHSGLTTQLPADAKNIKGKVLVCIGADDPGVSFDDRAAFEAEMRAGDVDWRLHLYGKVVHSFTNKQADKIGRPEFARYDAGADGRSWAEMISLFDEVFA